ncbi:MAG: hypothetical protein ACJ8LL_02770 [Candidatus Udaeobacter sp.]
MKRLLRIFELTKNEQRVVLIVLFVLIAIALIGYERRTPRQPVQTSPVIYSKPLPSPSETEDEH